MPTRYLKPGICDSELIDQLTPLTECLYYRLIVTVDDFGRHDARPNLIRSKCFPIKDDMTTKKVEKMLIELVKTGLIIVYQHQGKAYLQIEKWDNKPRSKESKCPAYTDSCIQLYTNVCSGNTNLPVTVTGTGTVTETETDILSGKPDESECIQNQAKGVLTYLNEKVGTHFRQVDSNLRLIKARINEGFSFEDFKQVIDKKFTEWANTERAQYLRPKTLFAAENFNNYVGQLKIVKLNKQEQLEQRNQAAAQEFASEAAQ